MGTTLSKSDLTQRVELTQQKLNNERISTAARIQAEMHAATSPGYHHERPRGPPDLGVYIKGFQLSYIDKATKQPVDLHNNSFGTEFYLSYGSQEWLNAYDRQNGVIQSIPTHSRWYKISANRLVAANTQYWLVLEPVPNMHTE